jgi:hypothetical protein
MEEKEQVFDDDRAIRELMNFKFIINLQINDCRRKLALVRTVDDAEIAQYMVDMLESLLVIKLDKKYETAKFELNDIFKFKVNKLNTAQTKDPHTMMVLKKDFSMAQFRLLMELSARTGLTTVREVEEEID